MVPAVRRSIVEHLDLAWSQVGETNGDLDLPDPISFADVQADWVSFRANIVRKVADDDYQPDTVEVVDLPKDRLTVRPLARLHLPHRLIYDAAVLASAPEVSATIPKAVYSHRWWRRESRFLAPKSSWIRMQRAARRLHKRNPFWLLARTDVTAFYEYVDIDTMVSDLSALPVPEWSVELLDGFLSAFNELNNVSGIPQGSDASGILANLYLRPVDLEIQNLGLTHYRYSDDILVFGPDWLSLRSAIIQINRLLRARRLSLSSSKTRIIDHRSVSAEFEDMEKDAINYGLRVGLPGSVDELKDFFNRTVSKDPVSARDLRYSLTNLRKSKNSYAVSWLLQNLGEIPHLAREALAYLSHFHHRRPKIGQVVADSLLNSKLVIYPFAQQHLLIYMIHHGVVGSVAKKSAWKLLLDRNQESFVREFAARYVGLYAADGARLRQEFQQESDPRVRRALLVACYESGRTPTNFLRTVSKSVPSLRLTAEYLRGSPDQIPLPAFGGKV